ncbi:MAG: hypothetical protein SV186_06440 [Candidatus Nanohaloarchaea archaeon]|nr:hypothetical protein [Candidatus Nanohaloarchaea archaeon]
MMDRTIVLAGLGLVLLGAAVSFLPEGGPRGTPSGRVGVDGPQEAAYREAIRGNISAIVFWDHGNRTVLGSDTSAYDEIEYYLATAAINAGVPSGRAVDCSRLRETRYAVQLELAQNVTYVLGEEASSFLFTLQPDQIDDPTNASIYPDCTGKVRPRPIDYTLWHDGVLGWLQEAGLLPRNP